MPEEMRWSIIVRNMEKISRLMPLVLLEASLWMRLKNGRKIENLFVYKRADVMGVYGLESIDFEIQDIVDIELSDLDHLPLFESDKWWRFDGTGVLN